MGRVWDSGSSGNQALLGKGEKKDPGEMKNGPEKRLRNDPYLPIRMLLGMGKDPQCTRESQSHYVAL